MDRDVQIALDRLRAKINGGGRARKPRASKKHIIGWKVTSQNETVKPCLLCGEGVETTDAPGPGGPAYMDGWHHWDCLDAHNGVVRDEEGNRTDG